MPSVFLETIARPVLEFVLYVVCYYVGRVVVPLVTFGRVKCVPAWSEVEPKKARGLGIYYTRNRRIFLTTAAIQIVGLIVIVLFIVGGLFAWSVSMQADE